MKDPNVPVADGDHQAAIDYTTKQFTAVLTRFVARKEQLSSLFTQELTKIDRYVESMLDLIVGNIQWSISCKRYSLFADEEAKRTGLITISTGYVLILRERVNVGWTHTITEVHDELNESFSGI